MAVLFLWLKSKGEQLRQRVILFLTSARFSRFYGRSIGLIGVNLSPINDRATVHCARDTNNGATLTLSFSMNRSTLDDAARTISPTMEPFVFQPSTIHLYHFHRRFHLDDAEIPAERTEQNSRQTPTPRSRSPTATSLPTGVEE